MLSNTPAAPLECDHCSGSGTTHEYRGPRQIDARCEDCDGRGDVACTLCQHHEPATRMAEDQPVCEACGALCDADAKAYAASLCSAGINHADAKRDELVWRSFRYVGQHSDEVETIEMRNCRCGSTLARVIATVTEMTYRADDNYDGPKDGEAWSGGFAENH